MSAIPRFFMTISAVSFFVVVYLVQKEITPFSADMPVYYKYLTYAVYVSIPFVFGGFSILLRKLFGKDDLKGIKGIETSNNDFLANYLSFFFVALSVNHFSSFVVVFTLTVIFTFFSRVSFFNPVYLIFGYNFFYVTRESNVKIMLITKEKIKEPKKFDSMRVRRINDYTFIED